MFAWNSIEWKWIGKFWWWRNIKIREFSCWNRKWKLNAFRLRKSRFGIDFKWEEISIKRRSRLKRKLTFLCAKRKWRCFRHFIEGLTLRRKSDLRIMKWEYLRWYKIWAFFELRGHIQIFYWRRDAFAIMFIWSNQIILKGWILVSELTR